MGLVYSCLHAKLRLPMISLLFYFLISIYIKVQRAVSLRHDQDVASVFHLYSSPWVVEKQILGILSDAWFVCFVVE